MLSKALFLHLLSLSNGFVFDSINVLYYIYRFVCIEPPLCPWDNTDLVTVNDLSDMWLDLVCHCFIEDFCIDVHLGDWPIVLLFGGVFFEFWDECNTGFIECVRQYSFPFYSMDKFKESWY
jgi:hypothetical protein